VAPYSILSDTAAVSSEKGKLMPSRVRRAGKRAGCLRFIWAGLAKHRQTGGIVPSQRFLIGKMIEPVPRAYPGQIIELGAGNGALTLRLGKRCSKAHVLACELNPVLARDLRTNLAAAGLSQRTKVLSDSAEHLLFSRLSRRLRKPDYIISGVPLSNLGRRRARELIYLISRALAGGGLYIQFQHSLLDLKNLKALFLEVRVVPVFFNFPPAVVYYAQGPSPTADPKGRSCYRGYGVGLDAGLRGDGGVRRRAW
jgi:phospholipid N-methyltransferase